VRIGKQIALALLLASSGCAPKFTMAEIGAGTYVAGLPSASGCGRRMLLELFSDQSYVFVQRYLCKPWSSAQMETGTWKSQDEELTLSSGAKQTRFTASDGGLDYVGNRYGKAGLHLQRAQ